ncbi:MAG: DUF5069 domain-containing protein [Verrucomicrobiaceae bacterium]|nr:MAG: DUF5069 domain-containing protein [Verrucomicrobiaceae bacterium]
MSNTTNISAPDLTQRPPRSARVRLGGYALLPRMLDKGRATIAGKNGEYHYNCPLDQNFVKFVDIDAEALKEQLAAGKGDGEILEWINSNSKNKRSPWEVEQWSHYQETRVVGDVESREFFHGIHKDIAPHREDIATWADVLDLDDHVSFGGKA